MKRIWSIRSTVTMFVTVLVLAFSNNACQDNGEPVASMPPLPGPPTSYSYSGYNSKGVLIVVGSMTLAVTESQLVSGTWTLGCIVPGEKVGPQTGSGILRGSIEEARVSIDLNPGWADNNVFLSGTFDKDRFIGTWMWSTLVGSTAAGRFEAVKIR